MLSEKIARCDICHKVLDMSEHPVPDAAPVLMEDDTVFCPSCAYEIERDQGFDTSL